MASSTRDQEPKAKALKGKGIRCTNQQGDEQGGTRPPHVYLVFDDWPSGYSIREVIPPRYGSSHHCHTAAASEPDTVCVEPPPPVVVRLEAVRESPCHFPVAFGTKILAVHTRDLDGRISSHPGDSMLMLMFDVCERSLTFCAGQDFLVYPIYFSVGDKLFCLSYGFFQMLIWEPGNMARESSWKELPDPPFRRYDVTSYAVHPKLPTFIVSTKEGATEATFAFDTEKLSWKHLGGWALPFAGRGHFDQDHGLFIGLSKEAGSSLGQLCSCYPDTPYMTTLAKENLFSEDPAERHEGATLVHIGPNKFCLVQCICRELDLSERRQFLYRLTTLSLEHRHTGGLTIREKQPVQYYQAVAELRGGHPGPPPPLHHEKISK